jgi:hypothetical protein
MAKSRVREKMKIKETNKKTGSNLEKSSVKPFDIIIPQRHVHLDFHTPALVGSIACEFDPGQFAKTLKKAKVQSVTCFARCHHGFIYYDSKINPERVHPGLERNLLKEQIDACHDAGLKVQVYTTIQWDHYTALQHPEWIVRNKDGSVKDDRPGYPGFYKPLAINSGYKEFLRNHINEILELFDCDGMFFDIVNPKEDYSQFSLSQMSRLGLDPENEKDRYNFSLHVIHKWMLETTALVHSIKPGILVFYNSGHVSPSIRQAVNAYTHLEIESLPSGGWGYSHLPVCAGYARSLGLEALGMTGKFHTGWGDFHSYKNSAALEFECNRMISLNLKCSIGDQMLPSGRLCSKTYRLIESIYSQIEKKSPWCQEAEVVTETAIMNPEEFKNFKNHNDISNAAIGTSKILQQCGIQYDVIDSQCGFVNDNYKVIILPDEIPVNQSLEKKLNDYLSNGGCLLVSHRSGLDIFQEKFFAGLGIEYVSPAPYEPDFFYALPGFSDELSDTEYVMYMRGTRVSPNENTKILAHVKKPYCNRTEKDFFSHMHSPVYGEADYPAVVQKKNVIYLAHPVFSIYNKYAPAWCKQIAKAALRRLMPEQLVRTSGPSSLVRTFSKQDQYKRYVLHLLNYIPQRQGQMFDTIEDVIPIYNIDCSIMIPEPAKSVKLVPEDQEISFELKNNRIEFVVPCVNGHQMVEITFS